MSRAALVFAALGLGGVAYWWHNLTWWNHVMYLNRVDDALLWGVAILAGAWFLDTLLGRRRAQPPHNGPKSGFTLIELVVAILVIAVIGLALAWLF